MAASAVPATVALTILLVLLPGRRELELDVYVLLLGGLTLLELGRATRAAHPRAPASAFERALRRRPVEAQRPAELATLERAVALGAASAFYLHARLRPLVRAVADERLRVRRGIDLEAQPEAAGRALGDEAWDLVRPDRPRPVDPDAPGLPLARLDSIVTTLERL